MLDYTFWLIIFIAIFYVIVLGGLFSLRWGMHRRHYGWCKFFLEDIRMIVHNLLEASKPNDAIFAMKELLNAIDDYLEKRNRFWELFGQVTLSVVVVFAITVLLLTKTIDADAGLPILTAVVAFAIGKGIDSKKTHRRDGSPPTDSE